jgi:hypothetical protein
VMAAGCSAPPRIDRARGTTRWLDEVPEDQYLGKRR